MPRPAFLLLGLGALVALAVSRGAEPAGRLVALGYRASRGTRAPAAASEGRRDSIATRLKTGWRAAGSRQGLLSIGGLPPVPGTLSLDGGSLIFQPAEGGAPVAYPLYRVLSSRGHAVRRPAVTLLGIDRPLVVPGDPSAPGLQILASGVRVQGFEVAGFQAAGPSCAITASSIPVSGALVIANVVHDNFAGICFFDVCGGEIRDNTADRNTIGIADSGGGPGGPNLVIGNRTRNNEAGIFVGSGATTRVDMNEVSGNVYGIALQIASGGVVSRNTVVKNDLIGIVEESFSSPTYEVLKRSDEAKVVVHAHQQPRFVEDVVRTILGKLLERYPKLPDDTLVTVRSESEESIHKHNAFAERITTLGEVRVGP
jgi:parallel beta-helix repeat protein